MPIPKEVRAELDAALDVYERGLREGLDDQQKRLDKKTGAKALVERIRSVLFGEKYSEDQARDDH